MLFQKSSVVDLNSDVCEIQGLKNIMLQIWFYDCFIAEQKFQIFSTKFTMMVKVFRYLPKLQSAVYKCSMKKTIRPSF